MLLKLVVQGFRLPHPLSQLTSAPRPSGVASTLEGGMNARLPMRAIHFEYPGAQQILEKRECIAEWDRALGDCELVKPGEKMFLIETPPRQQASAAVDLADVGSPPLQSRVVGTVSFSRSDLCRTQEPWVGSSIDRQTVGGNKNAWRIAEVERYPEPVPVSFCRQVPAMASVLGARRLGNSSPHSSHLPADIDVRPELLALVSSGAVARTWASFVAEEAERLEAVQGDPRESVPPQSDVERACPRTAAHCNREELMRLYVFHVSSYGCPMELGTPRPRSVPELVGLFASTGVENTEAYLQAALILGHPARELLPSGAGAPSHTIAASLERLASNWVKQYRRFPSLFARRLPTVGDPRFGAWMRNIRGACDWVKWPDPRSFFQDGVVSRRFFEGVLRSAVVWRCISQASGRDAHTGASWTPTVIQRAGMLAAVLGSVDAWSRRQLVVNGFLVAQLPWELFCQGDWRSVCACTRASDDPTPLAARVAGWVSEHCSCVPDQGHNFHEACALLRSSMDTYRKPENENT